LSFGINKTVSRSDCNFVTAWLIGAKQFIMFGSAGSLNEEKTKGKFVIPTEAYRDEGMSYHYAPAKDHRN
jgi:uridine phosphorylase